MVADDAIETSYWYAVIWREKPTCVWKPSGRKHVCKRRGEESRLWGIDRVKEGRREESSHSKVECT